MAAGWPQPTHRMGEHRSNRPMVDDVSFRLLDDLERFVTRLAATGMEGMVNPYAPTDEVPGLDRPGAAAIRAANLLDYLCSRQKPRLLLIEHDGIREDGHLVAGRDEHAKTVSAGMG